MPVSLSLVRGTHVRPDALADGDGAQPLWLTRNRWPLFGWVHQPETRPRAAVVLCPPLLGEHAAAYDLHREMAELLAPRGVLVVRFDYEGTGDSAGPSGGSARADAWLDGVDQAVSAARERCDGPMALLGVRSGALVAALAAQRRRDVDAIVLWDPWKSGRAFLRRQHALHALRQGDVVPGGKVEVPGFVVDAAAAESLNALRIPSTLHVQRALVVRRPGSTPPHVALTGRGDGTGIRAETIETVAGEQEACFDVDALYRRLPEATARLAATWLHATLQNLAESHVRPATGVAQARAADRRPGTARWAHGAGRRADGAVRRRAPSVTGTERVPIRPSAPGEVTVYERAVSLGDHGFFGIETVGDAASVSSGPTVVFLSSGTDPHVGPSRLWVDLARRVAAAGLRCVRVDFSGYGDSAPRPGHHRLVVRAPEAFDDVAEIVDAVGGPERAVLVGLCSGAYQALESALELHPLAVLGVNPILRFTPPEVAAGEGMSPRRRLCELRAQWVPAVRSWVPGPVVRAAVQSRRAWRWRRADGDESSWLDELAVAGVRVYLVCGTEEVQAIPAVRLARPPGDAEGEQVQVDVIDDLDHALTVAAHRREVCERFTDYLRGFVPTRVPS